MSLGKAKTIKVAAVQCLSENGKIKENLKRALNYIEEAAAKGAELVLTPEFLPTGYIFDKSIWTAGEPTDGITVQWLREHSKRLGVYIGTSFLEAEGMDFFNTFVLTSPDGTDAGRVRKERPSFFEAFFTWGDVSDHIIETDLGRIGVGICYENHLEYMPRLVHKHSPDLILMPHSAPIPEQNFFVSQENVRIWHEMLKTVPRYYAEAFGIPIVMTNKCGPWKSPLPFIPMKQNSKFPGLSAIVDSDATVKAQLGDEEGVLIEDVVLDPERKTSEMPPVHGRWAREMPWKSNLFRVVEAAGSIWYRHNKERKRRVVEIST